MTTNPRPNPYVGPRAFETGETLYGRDLETRQVLDLLISERIVLLHSPSGAGKSSLIHATLIPGLQVEDFTVLPVARVNLEPDDACAGLSGYNRYAHSLLVSLEEGRPEAQRRTPERLASLSLRDYLDDMRQQDLERSKPPSPGAFPEDDANREYVLILDQFEEILTTDRGDRAGKRAFFRQLGDALADPRLWALLAMREDYLGALDPYLRPVPTRLSNTYRLDLLGEAAALQAVQRPPNETHGVTFDAQTAQRLVDDLRRTRVQQPDGTVEEQLGLHVEPLQLQVVAYRLWQSLAPDATHITQADLDAMGDVDQALEAYYAERVAAIAAETGLRERSIRAWVDEHLITEQGLRGQVLMGAQTSGGLDNKAIAGLQSCHLVRAEPRGGRTWFELTHDRLVEPLRRNNAAWVRANLSLLQRQAALWETQKRPDGLLLSGDALAEAETWAGGHAENLVETERDFLQACREEQRRILQEKRQNQRIRWLALAMTGVALVAIAVMLFALKQFKLAEARRILGEAQIALNDQNPHIAALLALESQRLMPENKAPIEDFWKELTFEPKPISERFFGHSSFVSSVAWSGDGRLASGSDDGTVIVWDPTGGQPAQTLTGHSCRVTSVAWSGNGLLASGSNDGTIVVWNLESGQPAQTLTGYSDNVASVAWASDGRLASGSDDGTVIVWDLTGGQPAQTLTGHSESVASVAWSGDGRLASGSGDGTVIVWDLASGQPAQTLTRHSAYVRSVAWSGDGRLASGSDDGTAIVWNLAGGQPAQTLHGHSAPVLSVAWPSDGRLASGSWDGTVIVWDLTNGQPAQILHGHSAPVHSVAWSGDGRLASGSGDGAAIVWDLAGGQPAQTLIGHSNWVHSVAWSGNGWLASASADNTVIVWKLAGGQPAQTLYGHSASVGSVAWSGDGRLASGSDDGTVIVWDLANGQPARTLRGHSDWVLSVAWSGDGRLASGSDDGTVIVWDLDSGQPAQILIGHSAYVNSVAWSSDGRLASGSDDGTVIAWDLVSGQPAQTLIGHAASVLSVAWSSDGRLASGSYDSTVIVWNLERGQPAQILKGRSSTVSSVAWSSDGRLASASADNTVIVYSFIATECDWLFSNLSEAEWRRYIGDWFVYHPTCPDKASPTIQHPLLTVRGRWLLATALFGPILLFGVGIGGIRGKTRWRRALRGAATGALLGFVGTLLFFFLRDDGIEAIFHVFMDFEGYAFPLIVVTLIGGVVYAIGLAVMRPGKTASQVFWGVWAGCALLGGVGGRLWGQEIAMVIILVGIAGTVGGLVVAVSSAVFGHRRTRHRT